MVGCIFYHRDVVAKLSGITNRCLHTGVGDESHDDEPLDAVFFEPQIQIRVGEAAGTPMLLGHDIARPGHELAADLATLHAIFEGRMRPSGLLNGHDVLSSLVIARTVAAMQRIENGNARLPRRVEHLRHMRNTLVGFSNTLQAIPYLASLGDEIVVGIDDEKGGDFPLAIVDDFFGHS
jgi:hypothetical protein